MRAPRPSSSSVNFITRSRVWRSFFRHGWPDNPRDRSLVMTTNVFFHLHPVKVNRRSLRVTYSFGLGVITTITFVALVITGLLLMFWYVPTPEHAYNSLLQLQTEVPFGQLVRNLHRWAAHLTVIVAILHLARVFYTGAYKPPREFNWVVGVLLLLLTLAASFTGYLLPWDQLSYWAVTVGSNMIEHAPLIGKPVQQFLLGGSEVGAASLLRFYVLHIAVIPIGITLLLTLHLWRVRKDGGLAVEKQRGDTVFAFPVIALIELALIAGVGVVLTLAAVAVNAPLEAAADPNLTPDPSKAPWYFVGLQELLEHGHPLVMAVGVPLSISLFLLAIPYLDQARDGAGRWFTSKRGQRITLLTAWYTALAVPILIALSTAYPPRELLRGQAPDWVAQGLIPGGALLLMILLPLIGLQFFKPTTRERLLALFTVFFIASVVFTLTGLLFRGPGFQLYWPWAMPDGYHPLAGF
jgi:quinol-cytochrome oxidoreductase complex cytochrome b subunit